MNIREAVLEEHSRMQSDIISAYIGNRRERFDELMALVFTNKDPLARRAAWTMGHCCREHPQLLTPHCSSLLKLISDPRTHPSITRNALLVFQTAEIPSDLRGKLFNLCYDKVDNPDEMAATRIYAMTILARICRWEPGLSDEVELLIKQNLRHSSNGFKGRARHLLNDLRKETD
ncbi:hypothetical protein VSU19_06185 [Verrucomicrobiales bacterium BCK34]|nr:hypothetical protein [Verrucomicrobiales bacterium BCK34]